MRMDKGTFVRTVVLTLALGNQFLVATGLNPIPGTQEEWGEVISTGITVGAAIWAWFKNNYVTSKGKKQKEVLQKHGLTK